MNSIDATDRRLLDLLTENSRQSVTDIAKKMGASRVTVQERIRRLEKRGVIQGYTIRFNPDYLSSWVTAHVMIATDQKNPAQLNRSLEKISAVKSLYSISGEFDIFAILQGESTAELDREIDNMCALDGVKRTMTSIVLSKKFER